MTHARNKGRNTYVAKYITG